MLQSRYRWLWPYLVGVILLLSGYPWVHQTLESERALRVLFLAWEPVRLALTPPACPAPYTFPQAAFFMQKLHASPDNLQWMTHTARALWLNGDCVTAQRLWQTAAQAGYTEAWFELLTTGADMTWPEEGAPALERFAAWKGDTAKKAELPSAALWWYRRAFTVLPTRTSAQRVAGMVRDPAAQLEVWTALVKGTPESDSSHWWGLAKSAELRRMWGVAAVAYEQGASLSDKPYDFWMGAGAAWQRLKAWDRVEAAYRAAAQARPDITSPWLSLGHLFRGQQRWDEARAAYLEAQRIKPTEFYAPLYLGILSYETGDDVTARSYLMQALELKPEEPFTAYYLAQVSYREGKVEEAEQWMTQAVAGYATQKPYGWALQLGDWRLELGRCASAREAYDQARAWGLPQQTYDARLQSWTEQCEGK